MQSFQKNSNLTLSWVSNFAQKIGVNLKHAQQLAEHINNLLTDRDPSIPNPDSYSVLQFENIESVEPQ